jgi:hypothetical protein
MKGLAQGVQGFNPAIHFPGSGLTWVASHRQHHHGVMVRKGRQWICVITLCRQTGGYESPGLPRPLKAKRVARTIFVLRRP